MQVGEIRRHDNAVAVRVDGGWTVVWTLFTDGTSRRGYFYSDGSKTALWAESGQTVRAEQ